jgi:hypothetical protein
MAKKWKFIVAYVSSYGERGESRVRERGKAGRRDGEEIGGRV